MKLPQYNLGPFIGGVRFLAANAMFYISLLSIFFTSSAAYSQIREWFPFLNYWMIAGFVVFCFFFVMLFEHIFIYKSQNTYLVRQSYGRHNPTVVLLQEMQKEIHELKAEIIKLNEK